MLSSHRLTRFVLLPELRLTAWKQSSHSESRVQVKKTSLMEVCPKCATPSTSIYDHRIVTIKDAPLRGNAVILRVKKRRFYCKACRKPFTEPVEGIGKRHRTTWRYRREVTWAAENFSDLSKVRKAYRCSSAFIYRILFEQLELKRRREINYPWPTTIGIDEHFFTRRKGRAEFATVFTDYNNKRLREVAFGKVKAELIAQVEMIPGRENVKNVILDMSDTYRSFVKDFFPNAQLIADKFHVLRLLTPALNKHRVAITGDKRKLPIRRLLMRPRFKLRYYERHALDQWLLSYPELREIYAAKEAIYSVYRIKGKQRAERALTRLTDLLAHSKLKEIKRFRRKLVALRKEILSDFENRLTNARTEGFNNVAKLVQKRAYGYRSFANYRLRLLNACA